MSSYDLFLVILDLFIQNPNLSSPTQSFNQVNELVSVFNKVREDIEEERDVIFVKGVTGFFHLTELR